MEILTRWKEKKKMDKLAKDALSGIEQLAAKEGSIVVAKNIQGNIMTARAEKPGYMPNVVQVDVYQQNLAQGIYQNGTFLFPQPETKRIGYEQK